MIYARYGIGNPPPEKKKKGNKMKTMGHPLPKLTRSNQHKFFGERVKHGDLFNYTFSSFLWGDVEFLAKRHGFWVEYCKPGTKEYKVHGDATCYAYEKEKSAEEMIKNSEPSIPEKWLEYRDKIGDLVLRFETKKNEVAKLRDDLRSISEEINEIVESIDDGVEGFNDALETFRHALDDISRYI